ncbi:MAG: transglutaminase domain-containing protein [Victivallales bacterium]|nr:transglutaminase domain-containing protein [Victivallales bacterium]
MQLLHLHLFLCGVFAAIFLHGDEAIMYIAMGGAACCFLLSLISLKYFPPFLRQALQLAAGALTLLWASRVHEHLPMDILLVEIASMLGAVLFIGRTRHEYALIFFISIGFLGYGGLMPGRIFYLQVFILAIFHIMLILYSSASPSNGTPQSKLPMATQNAPYFPKHPISHRFIHIIGTIMLVLLMLHSFPQMRSIRKNGLIPVSFATEQNILFPHVWDKWHKPPTKKTGGDVANNNAENVEEPKKNSNEKYEIDNKAPKIINSANQPAFDSRNGNGISFAVGDKLVFRARSPAKLYWVMQLFDTYDGNIWTTSKIMNSAKAGPDKYIPVNEVEVPQHISLENPVSTFLPYQFRARQAAMVDSEESIAIRIPIIRRSPFTLSLPTKGNLPPAPWRYRVQSFVPNPDIKKPPRAWREPQRNNGWNYRRLPADLVSDRVRQLAKDITAGAENPFEKAIRIRDYLRNNYTYSLDAPQVPADREVVDYFLFESKTGYCQHFAQAFTVLARLAGLHSRLAIGYAPGNYNLLTNYFEVFEYHAHAWTQIFAEPYGWLTFDGVAPGNLNIQNTPAMLTSLIDPFGDEWKAHPPELTYIPPPPPEQSMVKGEATQKTEETFAGKVYNKASEENMTQNPNALELTKAAAQIGWQASSNWAANLWRNITQTTIMAWNGVRNSFIIIIYAFRRMSLLETISTAFALLVIIAAFSTRKILFRKIAFLWRLYRCRCKWFLLERRTTTARERICTCHDVTVALLKLAALKRPADRELGEWAKELATISAEISSNLLPIANASAIVQFSDQEPSERLADDAINALPKLSHALSPFLTDALRKA